VNAYFGFYMHIPANPISSMPFPDKIKYGAISVTTNLLIIDTLRFIILVEVLQISKVLYALNRIAV